MNYIIKSRYYIRKESRKREVYNVCLVTRLIDTILCTDRVAVLAELSRDCRYYKYRTAFNQRLEFFKITSRQLRQ